MFTLAWRMADDFGCVGVVVDTNTEAVGHDQRLGFAPLAHSKGTLGDRPRADADVSGTEWPPTRLRAEMVC